ncbi:patatin-like phospholipase family protein [Legionella sp. W05-934-2]|jgi:NTE family protein|uniref:patatin-like phospholipase family protein n=1 Tax=Legionella sp. W05-934-2 TaxID=1198649 RepID=UPI0034619D08
MKTAFVLSGGGSLGSVQVGMLIALMENGIFPDLIVGTSVGAINASLIAGDPTLAGANRLKSIWLQMKRHHIFPSNFKNIFLGIFGHRNHLVSNEGLKSIIRKNLDYTLLEEAKIPIHVIATEVKSGAEVILSEGNAVEAITASAAIPGVFPPVNFGQDQLVDGGVVNNTPISYALKLGAESIWVLPTGYACDLTSPPDRAVSMLMHSISLLIQQRLLSDIHANQTNKALHVIPPLCPITTNPTDLSQTKDYMDRSYQSTIKWLQSSQDLEQALKTLTFHRH